MEGRAGGHRSLSTLVVPSPVDMLAYMLGRVSLRPEELAGIPGSFHIVGLTCEVADAMLLGGKSEL